MGWFGFLFLPWNAIGGQGFLAFNWVAAYPLDARVAPAAVQLVYQGRAWLLPLAATLVLPLFTLRGAMSDRVASRLLIVSGALGVATIAAVAAAIDIGGWTWPALAALFGPLRGRQPGLGYGALAVGRRRADVRLPRSCVARLGPRRCVRRQRDRCRRCARRPVHALPAVAPARASVRRFRRARIADGVDRAYRIEPDLGRTAVSCGTR